MQGFKSFADRTSLSFDDGLTAIVGPNGSGKSNVSDAIKWVFGEQSVKSLRGSKMEDVIFSGTQSRKSQGYCTVVLTIDNTDRAVDIDTDELVIARKLYRTGESEYRLNGSSVRLRDINEIFMDTGLGRDGYSIIEQGRIADIISSKSHQRREIFEEAAGISRYRYKKQEAVRQLDSAQENLLRLKDILHELEDRILPLKAQSEKAEEFLLLAGEKRQLELSLWTMDIADIAKNLRELEDKVLVRASEKEGIDLALLQLDEDLAECESIIQQLSVYMERCRAKLLELNNSISDAQTQISELSSAASYKSATADSIEQRIVDFNLDTKELGTRLLELKLKSAELVSSESSVLSEIASLTGELAALGEQQTVLSETAVLIKSTLEQVSLNRNNALADRNTNTALASETTDRLNSLIQTNELAESEKISGELKKAEDFLAELRAELESLSNTQQGYDYKLASKQSKLDEIEQKIFALEKKSAEKLQRAQLLSDLDKSMEGYSGSVKHVLKLSSALGGLYGTLGSLINVGEKLQRAQLLSDLDKSMEGYSGSVKHVLKLSSALGGLYGTLGSLINVGREYAVAVETALGGAIGNLVVYDEQSAKRYVSALKKSSAGRATFLPISTVSGRPIDEAEFCGQAGFIAVASELVECDSKFRGVVSWTLGRTIVAENLDFAINIGRFCKNKYRIVTLDGQLVNAGGSITGGSVGKSGDMLSRRLEIEQLNAEAAKLLAQVADIEAQQRDLNTEISVINAKRQSVDSEIQTVKEDIIITSAQCRSLSDALEQSRLRADKVREQVELLNRRITELENDNKNIGDSISALDIEHERLLQRLCEIQADSTEIAQKSSSLENELKNREFVRLSLEKDITAISGEVARLEEKLSTDTQRQEQLQRDMTLLRAEADELKLKIQHNEEHILACRRAMDDTQQDIDQKRSELMLKEKQGTELRGRERQLAGQRDIVSLELGKLEERKKSVLHENDELVRKLFDEYELTLSEAKEQAIQLESRDTAHRRLLELKSKIRAMGNINVGAIEEYSEVKTRYDFMRAQFDDAEVARNSLIELIQQLSTDMSNMFLDKFSKISTAFNQIFMELFGGGSARLWLDEPSSPLESSIEIEVQPPGKLIKNLSSLSGGEQAMVAICIYFAILSVSPSPFVLIDEIEAALDDVNVARFASYIARLTKNTQFISITHRRGTMEQADVLYGVTMEEKGVSKLLRLDVAELEEKLQLNMA